MFILKVIVQVVLVAAALISAILDYGNAERGTHAFLLRRTVLIFLMMLAAASNIVLEWAAYRREQNEDQRAVMERRKNDQRLESLRRTIAAERVAHERESRQALAALDQLHMHFAQLQSRADTQELRNELARYQSELRTAQKVLMPAPKAVLFAAGSDPVNSRIVIAEPEVRLEGNIASVRLWVYNTSQAHANTGSIWFKVYGPPEVISLPSQLNPVEDASSNEITGRFPHIAANERTGPFDFRLRIAPGTRSATVGFRYSCQTCAAEKVWQQIKLNIPAP